MKPASVLPYICDIEIAKQLKVLGIVQQSYWDWYIPPGDSGLLTKIVISEFGPTDAQRFSAYTVGELGILLPDYIISHDGSYRMHFNSYKQEQENRPPLFTMTYGKSEDKDIPDFDEFKEANGRGKLLVHLIENKFCDVQKINTRYLLHT